MKIGIIGAGNVGGALGTRFAQNGHSIIFSSRDPQSAKTQEVVAKAGANARAATVAEAVRDSDVVVLATPWPTTEEAVKSAGDLSGKIVIDTTNPLAADLSGLVVGTTSSAAEQVSSWAPGAKVVKAFNTVGAAVMADTAFSQGKPILFYCGDDADAKQQVATLAAELGFEPQDAGALRQARLLEPFALLWISLAFQQQMGFHFAFHLMRL